MQEMEISLKPDIIGKNIRTIRKNKKITIVQLAEILGYATGKLSNIEKGKRAKFPYEELVEIANALNEPIEVFLEDESESYIDEFENLKQTLSFAKHKLSAGLFHGLNEMLEDLQKRIELHPNKGIVIHLSFLWAEYYRNTSDYELAQDYYRETIRSDYSDRDIVELKMRSYNGLASLLVKEHNLKDAISVLRSALNYSDKNSMVMSLDISNVHFNLTIIYLHIGYLDLAEFHINSCLEITKNKNEQAYYHAQYLLSITFWIRGKYNLARSLLFEAMNWFQRQKDLGNLFNSLELIFLIYRILPNKFLFIDNFSELREFVDLRVPGNIVEQKIRCLYRLIEIDTKNEKYDDARTVIEKCKQLIEEFEIKDGYRVYGLEAYLISKTTENRFDEQKAIEKALDYFTVEDRSADKAYLLYRLGKLTSRGDNNLYEDALSIFEEVYLKNNYLEESILLLLPQPRY